jgi:hypothetical protein
VVTGKVGVILVARAAGLFIFAKSDFVQVFVFTA